MALLAMNPNMHGQKAVVLFQILLFSFVELFTCHETTKTQASE